MNLLFFQRILFFPVDVLTFADLEKSTAEAGALLNLGFFALKPDKRLFQASLTLGGRRWQAVRSSSGDMPW